MIENREWLKRLLSEKGFLQVLYVLERGPYDYLRLNRVKLNPTNAVFYLYTALLLVIL
jgi:hypothetical protein